MYSSGKGRGLLAAALIIILVLSVAARTRIARPDITLIERLVSQVFSPAQRLFQRVSLFFDRISQEIRLMREARDENLMLREKVLAIPWLETDLQEAQLENDRLRELLKFSQAVPSTYIPAEVIGRNPDNWFDMAVINKGLTDGVAKDDPVVTSSGLVGRVVRATSNTATVMLLLDVDSGVGGLVQRSRDAGVVVGRGSGEQVLTMKLFSKDSEVMVGDVIVTSGLGSLFPKGLPIGEVVSVGKADFGLSKTADIRPFVNFDRLEEVLVLKADKEPAGEETEP